MAVEGDEVWRREFFGDSLDGTSLAVNIGSLRISRLRGSSWAWWHGQRWTDDGGQWWMTRGGGNW
jgi:hypothetical protein